MPEFDHQTLSLHATSTAPPRSEARSEPKTEARRWDWVGVSTTKAVQALIFGSIFGFLLQKAGVAKFDILIGALLLENFVVVKVMLSAIIVGMLGVYVLERMGSLELQIKETAYGSNIVGGLIFGVGFALIAYCPGTNAAAMGQGNLDAIVGTAGMVLGSYLFALTSMHAGGGITKWGNRGKITLADLLKLSRGAAVAIAAPLLILVLVLLETLGR